MLLGQNVYRTVGREYKTEHLDGVCSFSGSLSPLFLGSGFLITSGQVKIGPSPMPMPIIHHNAAIRDLTSIARY